MTKVLSPEILERLRERVERLDRYRFDFYALNAKTFCDNMRAITEDVDALLSAYEAMLPRPIEEAPDGTNDGITSPPFNGEALILIWHRPPAATKIDVGFWHGAPRRWCRLHEWACNEHPESQPTHFIPLSALPQPPEGSES